jgi:hypothetical protein
MTSSETIIGGMPIQVIKKKSLKNLYVRINPPGGGGGGRSPLRVAGADVGGVGWLLVAQIIFQMRK